MPKEAVLEIRRLNVIEAGGCMGCTRQAYRVWVITSRDRTRLTQIRFCHACMLELKRARGTY